MPTMFVYIILKFVFYLRDTYYVIWECWEIGAPNFNNDFQKVVPKQYDTTSADPMPILHREDLYLDSNTGDQHYKRELNFLFIIT